MGWISKIFGAKDQPQKKRRSSNSRQHAQRSGPSGNKVLPRPTEPTLYRAVSIHNAQSSCDAALRIRSQRFLSAAAPQLPLGGCSQPQQCQCRYKYHSDRRSEMRRDSDHGLPTGSFHGSNRRHRRERRRARASTQVRLNA